MRVLLAEDDRKVSSFIRRGLIQDGFSVDVSCDGRDAFHQAVHEPYDVVILDILMPYLSGFEVLSQLRKEKHHLPILVLSARCSVADKIRALNDGADDYLTKPFAFEELIARLRALLRRRSQTESPVLGVADLEIDIAARSVSRSGNPIKLTVKEFSLLEYLARHEGHVLTRTMIAEHVWDQHFDSFSNVIDVYIRYLRTKIDGGHRSKLIHTIRGVGYVLSEHAP